MPVELKRQLRCHRHVWAARDHHSGRSVPGLMVRLRDPTKSGDRHEVRSPDGNAANRNFGSGQRASLVGTAAACARDRLPHGQMRPRSRDRWVLGMYRREPSWCCNVATLPSVDMPASGTRSDPARIRSTVLGSCKRRAGTASTRWRQARHRRAQNSWAYEKPHGQEGDRSNWLHCRSSYHGGSGSTSVVTALAGGCPLDTGRLPV